MTLTKLDIIEDLAKTEFTRKRSVEVLENLLEIVKRTLESGEDILISGFGKFCVKEKGERRGRNPEDQPKHASVRFSQNRGLAPSG